MHHASVCAGMQSVKLRKERSIVNISHGAQYRRRIAPLHGHSNSLLQVHESSLLLYYLYIKYVNLCKLNPKPDTNFEQMWHIS